MQHEQTPDSHRTHRVRGDRRRLRRRRHEHEQQGQGEARQTAARHAQLEKNPYDLRCADLRDKLASADITRTVQNALASDAKIRGLNQLQASQSIFYAITELCKAKPGSYRPAKDAIAAVRSGELRARTLR